MECTIWELGRRGGRGMPPLEEEEGNAEGGGEYLSSSAALGE